MNRLDISALKRLSTAKELVPIEDIPASFKPDFNKFFFGKTLVKDSNNHLFAYPSDIKRWVRVLFSIYKDQLKLFARRFAAIDNSKSETHLISALTYFHNKFLNEIHPFADGNGRVCRIIMGTIMMKNNCPPVFARIISNEDSFDYIEAVITCENQNSNHPFIEFLANGMSLYMEDKANRHDHSLY